MPLRPAVSRSPSRRGASPGLALAFSALDTRSCPQAQPWICAATAPNFGGGRLRPCSGALRLEGRCCDLCVVSALSRPLRVRRRATLARPSLFLPPGPAGFDPPSFLLQEPVVSLTHGSGFDLQQYSQAAADAFLVCIEPPCARPPPFRQPGSVGTPSAASLLRPLRPRKALVLVPFVPGRSGGRSPPGQLCSLLQPQAPGGTKVAVSKVLRSPGLSSRARRRHGDPGGPRGRARDRRRKGWPGPPGGHREHGNWRRSSPSTSNPPSRPAPGILSQRLCCRRGLRVLSATARESGAPVWEASDGGGVAERAERGLVGGPRASGPLGATALLAAPPCCAGRGGPRGLGTRQPGLQYAGGAFGLGAVGLTRVLALQVEEARRGGPCTGPAAVVGQPAVLRGLCGGV